MLPDYTTPLNDIPQSPGKVRDAIGLDIEFLKLTEVADLSGKILQLVALQVQHTQVTQCRDTFGQALQMKEMTRCLS